MTWKAMGEPDQASSSESTPLTSDRIPVRTFRQILYWPLTVHQAGRTTASIGSVVEAQWKRLRAPWQLVPDPAQHIAMPTADPAEVARWRNEAYAECQYFHDFVSDFLFPAKKEEDSSAAFRLFRRTDISAVRVLCKGQPLTLAVERLNLYVFRTGAAVLVLELRATSGIGSLAPDAPPAGWSLATTQMFHDRFRRSHIPFADGQGNPGNVVEEVAWFGSGGEELGRWRIDADLHRRNVDAYMPTGGALARRDAPILPHWRFLLPGAMPLKDAGGEVTWQNVADERLPTLSHLSVTATEPGLDPLHWYRRIGRGDMIRLAFADPPGNDETPYDPGALTDFEALHAYDWFQSRGTRFLVAGHAFVAVGAGRFFDETVATHVRRHYFQMGLLLHFECVSLLAFSRAITGAADDYQVGLRAAERRERNAGHALLAETDAAFDAFAERLRGAQSDFLQFAHRFHFTGVSSQMQAGKLFDMWRERLGLPALFADLQAELRAGADYVHSEWQRREARAAEEQTAASNQLSAVAAVGVAVGLPLAFLGMNVLSDGPEMLLTPVEWLRSRMEMPSLVPPADPSATDAAKAPSRAHVVAVALVVGAALVLTGWLLALIARGIHPRGRSARPQPGPLGGLRRSVGLAGWIVLAFGLVLGLVR